MSDLCESPLTCHSEEAKRPKNLITTSKYEILRYAQDDKMDFRRGLNERSKNYFFVMLSAAKKLSFQAVEIFHSAALRLE